MIGRTNTALRIRASEQEIAILNRALDTLSYPEYWTKGVEACDIHEYQVEVDNDDAHCFCLSGAVRKAILELDEERRAIINEERGAIQDEERKEILYGERKAILDKERGYLCSIVLMERCMSILYSHIPSGEHDMVTDFNDHPDTTYHDVVSVLRSAINYSEEQRT